MASATLQPLTDLPTTRVKRPDAARFHVAPSSGWINDPNGPLLYANKHHL
jgi:sucrose-6-phosphate hydrolase SacC (GH32 family)